MEDLRGRQLGPYKIVVPIGRGGMGVVYKAYQSNMNRHVALKILPSRFTSDPDFVKRFKQEAELIAQLEHAYIVPVFDFGEIEGNIYISMRLVEGGTLADRLKRREPLPIAQIRRVISQVGEALDYAHSQGVIHRDVKPNNILVDQRNNCLLTDFGIAKILAASTHLTQEGTGTAGTPAYMSPEQILGRKLDGRTDVYSLGVVLFEMATGTIPFDADVPTAIFVKHIKDPLPTPRERNPQLPAPVEKVILKALEKQTNDRYATAGEMTKALRAATPATSFSESTQEDEALFAPTPNKIPAAIGQKTAETPTPPPVFQSTPPPPPQPLTRPEPAPKPATAWWAGGIAVGGVVLFSLLVCGLIGFLWLRSRSPTPVAVTPTAIIKITPDPMDIPQPDPDSLTSRQATAVANSVLVFEDDFSSNMNGWEEEEDSDSFAKYKTQVIEGVYRVSIQSYEGVFHRERLVNLQSQNFLLSVEASVAEADASLGEASMFLSFRENARSDYYVAEFYDNGAYKFLVRKNDKWKTLKETTSSQIFKLVPGKRTLFELVVVGSNFTLYANKQKVASVTDSTLSQAGKIGLGVSLDREDQVLTVDFDNLTIEEIPLDQEVADIQATATARHEAIAATRVAPTATAAARLAFIDSAPILFQDDFDANASKWPEGQFSDDGSEINRQITDGKYRMSLKTPGDYFIQEYLPDFSTKDFYAETTVAVVEDTASPGEIAVGFVFRRNESKDRYAVLFFSDNTSGFYVNQKGEWTTLQKFPTNAAFRLKPGSTNTFGVYAAGSSFTFYANGQELATVKDITLSEAGSVGIGIELDEANQSLTVDFDKFVIKDISRKNEP